MGGVCVLPIRTPMYTQSMTYRDSTSLYSGRPPRRVRARAGIRAIATFARTGGRSLLTRCIYHILYHIRIILYISIYSKYINAF